MLDAIHAAEEKRAAIAALGDGGETDEKARLLAEAERALADVRLAGDLVIAAFFGTGREKERERLRLGHEAKLRVFAEGRAGRAEVEAIVQDLRPVGKPLVPFHWEIEFPEVFSRANPGFDAFVGNPPFAGGKKVSGILGEHYRDWLIDLHCGANSNADLVAHFFRRAFSLIRTDATFGLIATRTIGLGDTRLAALLWICQHNGAIYAARKRLRWPGGAAVIVSVVHVLKGPLLHRALLDGLPVPRISAFLLDKGPDEDPLRLDSNLGRAFIGCDIKGPGFLFADESGCSPLDHMRRILAGDQRNAALVLPFIGGDEVNENPAHAGDRFAIDFGSRPKAEAREWPDLFSIVEALVKPYRLSKSADVARAPWWQFWRPRRELRAAMRPLSRVIARSSLSRYHCFTWLPSRIVLSHNLTVFPSESNSLWCVLHSRVHELFCDVFSSGLAEIPGYRLSDCFETFPLPLDLNSNDHLAASGRAYYDFRAALMLRDNEGLTATYNRFHDPDETSPDILRLRDLHAAMDRAVLDAYGWADIAPPVSSSSTTRRTTPTTTAARASGRRPGATAGPTRFVMRFSPGSSR